MLLRRLQVLALQVSPDRRKRALADLSVARLGQAVEVGPDAVGERPEDFFHLERVRAGVGLKLLVLEPRERGRAQAVAAARSSGWRGCARTRRCRRPSRKSRQRPSASTARLPSRRSKAGENWKAESARIESLKNFKQSRCLAPATGMIGSWASLSAL